MTAEQIAALEAERDVIIARATLRATHEHHEDWESRLTFNEQRRLRQIAALLA